MDIEVDCYAGYKGEETPRRLSIGAQVVEVAEVIDRWHGPDHGYFKVTGADGATYILRHDGRSGRWELVMYDRARS